MFVPFISSSSDTAGARWKLYRRKGGGGGGRGSVGTSGSKGTSISGSSSSSSKSSSSSSSGGSSSSSSWWSTGSSSTKYKTKTKSTVWKSSSSSRTSYKKVVGVAAIIPAGYPFAGRIGGGGTREQIFGTKTYGSGYPGVSGRGTSGRGFPFFFWPLSWPLTVGGGAGLYLHNNYEYGSPSNGTRPGGIMAYAIFPSVSNSSSTPSTFRFLADNATVTLMIQDVVLGCRSLINTTSMSKSPVAFGEGAPAPQPEQVVQYYRASTAALSLDNYNNTATYSLEGTADSRLPEHTDYGLMACLNTTIGSTVPLVDGALGMQAFSNANLLSLVGVIWWLLSIR